jgi:hypothetical protein
MSDSSIREGPSVGHAGPNGIPLCPAPCYPSKQQEWGSEAWASDLAPRGICSLDNGLPRKHEAGPMDGVLPEVDAGQLLQVEVWLPPISYLRSGMVSRL